LTKRENMRVKCTRQHSAARFASQKNEHAGYANSDVFFFLLRTKEGRRVANPKIAKSLCVIVIRCRPYVA